MIKRFSELMPGDRILFLTPVGKMVATCTESPIPFGSRGKMIGSFAFTPTFDHLISRDRDFPIPVFARAK